MASRTAKQRLDDKHEKLLRQATKKNGNNVCFDCSQKGPFSIVLELGTFVCNDCAGIHRGSPFNHHIKSISTSSFKPHEIQKILYEGGNERAAKIWTGKGSHSVKPRPGDTVRIKHYMEQKYIKKEFYVPPEIALANDIPEEDLSQTGILDQLPTPPQSRKQSIGRESPSDPKKENVDEIFSFDAPPPAANQQSFFSNDTSFFPSPGASQEPPKQPQSQPQPQAGSLLDFSAPQPPQPTPVQQKTQSSSISASLFDIDLGSQNVTPAQGNSMGSFGSMNSMGSFGSANMGANNSFAQQDPFGFGSTQPQAQQGTNNQFNSMQNMQQQDPFGFSSTQPQTQQGTNNQFNAMQNNFFGSQNNSQQGMNPMGNNSFQEQQFASNSNKPSLFDSLSSSLSPSQAPKSSVQAPPPRASLFDDPIPSSSSQMNFTQQASQNGQTTSQDPFGFGSAQNTQSTQNMQQQQMNNQFNQMPMGNQTSNSFGSQNNSQQGGMQFAGQMGNNPMQNNSQQGMQYSQGQQRQAQNSFGMNPMAGSQGMQNAQNQPQMQNSFGMNPMAGSQGMQNVQNQPQGQNSFTGNSQGGMQFAGQMGNNPMQNNSQQGMQNVHMGYQNNSQQGMHAQNSQSGMNSNSQFGQNMAQQQQPAAQQTNTTPSTEQLNFMQQKFVEKLKTLPVPQQQQMGSQYQQWNPQQRMQFLVQNFGSQLPQQQQAPPTHAQPTPNSFGQPQPQKPVEKGKYADMFGEFDILKSRR